MFNKCNAESACFSELVNSISSKDSKSKNTAVFFPRFECKYRDYCASSVPVCDTPVVLRNIGFEGKIIYDKTHFLNHMKSEIHTKGGAEHGHNGTKESLLELPHLLSHPVALMYVEPSEMPVNDNRAKPLLALYASKENNRQKYHFVVFHPYDFYNGTYNCYPASKIQSYYDVNENKFTKFLNAAIKNKSIVFLDKSEYNKISFRFGGCKGCKIESVLINIKKEYRSECKSQKQKLSDHQQLVSEAAQKSLFRFNNPHTLCTSSLHYTPFDEAVAFLNNKECQLSDLAQIQKMTKLTCDLSRDSQESALAIRKVDQLVAQKYSEIINAIKDQHIRERVAVIDNTIIESEEDLDEMYNCAELYRRDVPTLESCGILFSQQSVGCQEIQVAINDSTLFSSGCRDALCNVTNIKEDEYYRHIDDATWDINLSNL